MASCRAVIPHWPRAILCRRGVVGKGYALRGAATVLSGVFYIKLGERFEGVPGEPRTSPGALRPSAETPTFGLRIGGATHGVGVPGAL